MNSLRMNSMNLIRVGAVAAILAGVFIAGHGIPTMFEGNPMDLNSLADYLMEIIFGAGYVALLVVFVALLSLRTGRGGNGYGRLGRLGVYMALVGSVLIIVKTSLIIVIGVAFGAQAVMDILFLSFRLYLGGSSLVGLGLLGIDMLRARVLPRWFGLALIIVPLALLIVHLDELGSLWTARRGAFLDSDRVWSLALREKRRDCAARATPTRCRRVETSSR
jgi:hypothetical protein